MVMAACASNGNCPVSYIHAACHLGRGHVGQPFDPISFDVTEMSLNWNGKPGPGQWLKDKVPLNRLTADPVLNLAFHAQVRFVLQRKAAFIYIEHWRIDVSAVSSAEMLALKNGLFILHDNSLHLDLSGRRSVFRIAEQIEQHQVSIIIGCIERPPFLVKLIVYSI